MFEKIDFIIQYSCYRGRYTDLAIVRSPIHVMLVSFSFIWKTMRLLSELISFTQHESLKLYFYAAPKCVLYIDILKTNLLYRSYCYLYLLVYLWLVDSLFTYIHITYCLFRYISFVLILGSLDTWSSFEDKVVLIYIFCLLKHKVVLMFLCLGYFGDIML